MALLPLADPHKKGVKNAPTAIILQIETMENLIYSPSFRLLDSFLNYCKAKWRHLKCWSRCLHSTVLVPAGFC